MKTRTFERLIAALLVLAVVFLIIGIISISRSEAQVNPEENQVEFWCETGGIKYEPVDTPFIVPEPPEGKTWTIIVLKGGTTNEVIQPVVVGQGYSHSEHDNSHIILCWEDEEVTTTSTSTTTSSTSSTTSSTTTSSTTSTSTTTTDPTTTTSSSTTTTVADPTTSSSSSTTSTTSPPTNGSTVPPTTSTTLPILPRTGPPSGLSYGALGVTSLLLLVLGTATLVGVARKG